MNDADVAGAQEKLKVTFNDRNLLEQAFTHRSYLNENKTSNGGHNERLEFLGDAVLELSVTNFLYGKYPEKAEGELTNLRAALVNTQTISKVGSELGLGDYLLLSKGEQKGNEKAREYILANTYEAIIGAIYIDQGYSSAEKFIADTIFHRIDDIVANKLWIDSKSFFQEKAQEIDGRTPSYEILHESGPDHNKIFTVGVMIGGELIAKGKGTSKQVAEQDAAFNGLKARSWKI